jgi:serine/threonine protein kinase
MSARQLKLDPGTAVGPYTIQGPLARGSTGTVFTARDALGLTIALKVGEEPNASQRTRLLREARALMVVEHPGLARALGAGEHGRWLYFASEHVRGRSLRAHLDEEGAVLPARALRWFIEICDAVEAAHAAGVPHGDLHSGSVLITRNDRVKVVGACGPRRRVDANDDVEDVGHLAPEQIEHGLGDERSDVWALGCLLHELCGGEPPFGRSGRATVAAILRDDPVLPTSVSGSVADLIGACLRKMSFSRAASMRELASAARDALENPTAPASVTNAVERASERAARLTSRPPPVSAGPAPPRTSPPPASGGARASARPLPSQHPVRSSVSPLVDAGRGHFKGTALRAGVQWFAETYGAEALAGVVASASADLRAAVREEDPGLGIIPSSWYDVRVVGELLELFERAAANPDPEAHWVALTQAIARDHVHGVYKSLFRLVTSPPLLEANAQRVWRTYCDEGTLTAREVRSGELRFEVRGITVHHGQTCRAVGYVIQQALREVGYRGLVVERTQCLGEGHALCAFEGLYLP